MTTITDWELMLISFGLLAGFALGFSGGWHLRPKRKPSEITMLADGRMRVDTGYKEQTRSE